MLSFFHCATRKHTAKPHVCQKKQAAPLRVLLMEPLWWAYFQVLDRGSACLMTECQFRETAFSWGLQKKNAPIKQTKCKCNNSCIKYWAARSLFRFDMLGNFGNVLVERMVVGYGGFVTPVITSCIWKYFFLNSSSSLHWIKCAVVPAVIRSVQNATEGHTLTLNTLNTQANHCSPAGHGKHTYMDKYTYLLQFNLTSLSALEWLSNVQIYTINILFCKYWRYWHSFLCNISSRSVH